RLPRWSCLPARSPHPRLMVPRSRCGSAGVLRNLRGIRPQLWREASMTQRTLSAQQSGEAAGGASALGADLRVDLAPRNPRELVLRNPVIAASGTFGYGTEYAGLIDIQALGAICSKGVTYRRRRGAAMPRIAETPAGMLNAIGLQNPGIKSVLAR